MIGVAEKMDIYQTRFERLVENAKDGRAAWLLPIRKAAMARFAELGFPTTRDEEWRFTNVAPLAKMDFVEASDAAVSVSSEQIKPYRLVGDDGITLTFVDGRFVDSLSSVTELPGGATVCDLVKAISEHADIVEANLAKHTHYQDHAFTALNTALMEDGALIHIPKGVVVERPIHLLHITRAEGESIASHPRTLIVADANSQVRVVESYVALGSGAYFTNAVTEIVAGDGAVVDHYKLERESTAAFHIAALQLYQSRGSNVTSQVLSFGGAVVRNDIHTVLDGEGCDCTLNGLYMIEGSQHVDNHLVVEHAKPHCNSREFFKGVLDGHAEGVFSGRIIVHKGAQKTDAKQTNMSLLLSENAQVESKPQLEIEADDVKCTHGATIGQISDEAIYYLRSRGIGAQAARDILIHAFARETVQQIRVDSLRNEVERLLVDRIGPGNLLREAV